MYFYTNIKATSCLRSSTMLPSKLPHVSLPQQQQQVLNAQQRMMWFSLSFKNDEWKCMGQSDKATLHQSAIELRGSTVVSASRGLLVEMCPTPYARKRRLLFFSCVILPPLVCLDSDTTFLSFSLVYSLLQSCVCPQTGTLSSVRFFLQADAMILKRQ